LLRIRIVPPARAVSFLLNAVMYIRPPDSQVQLTTKHPGSPQNKKRLQMKSLN